MLEQSKLTTIRAGAFGHSRPTTWAIASRHAAKVRYGLIETYLHPHSWLTDGSGRSKEGPYESALADSEREAVADLLQYLENVRILEHLYTHPFLTSPQQRAETDFFTGDPLRSLSTLVYSENVELQRSASLTFAEITERGGSTLAEVSLSLGLCLLAFNRCTRSRPRHPRTHLIPPPKRRY